MKWRRVTPHPEKDVWRRKRLFLDGMTLSHFIHEELLSSLIHGICLVWFTNIDSQRVSYFLNTLSELLHRPIGHVNKEKKWRNIITNHPETSKPSPNIIANTLLSHRKKKEDPGHRLHTPPVTPSIGHLVPHAFIIRSSVNSLCLIRSDNSVLQWISHTLGEFSMFFLCVSFPWSRWSACYISFFTCLKYIDCLNMGSLEYQAAIFYASMMVRDGK